MAGTGDHLRRGVNAGHAARCANTLQGDQCERSGATSNIQHALSWLQPGQVDDALPAAEGDLDKAKTLLASAGVSNLTLDFVFAPTLPEYATIAQIYQSDLAKIGVTLNVKSMEIVGTGYRVQLDPTQLASRQIGIDEVTTALKSGNTNTPTGTLYANNKTFTILSNGQLANAQQFRAAPPLLDRL